MKRLFLILTLLMFSSCETLKGRLNVSTPLNFNEGSLAVGNYSAKAKFTSKTKLKLKVDVHGDNKTFKFRIPKDFDFPQNGGEFSLTADQVGQPYGVEGVVVVNVSRSDMRRGIETCSFQARVRICRRLPDGTTRCRYEYRTIQGRRSVSYEVVTEDKEIELDLVGAQNSDATFNGENQTSYRDYSYQGPCRR